MPKPFPLAAALFAAVSLHAFAAAPPKTAGAPSSEAVSPPSPETADPLAALAWLAGDWSGLDEAGVLNEERWTEAAGGMMLAVHRDVSGGKAVSFEFLRIEATPGDIIYFASPRGKPPTPFRMVEGSASRVVFENAQHDFPRRVLYWPGPAGELHARIEGTLNGKPASEEWTWKRRK